MARIQSGGFRGVKRTLLAVLVVGLGLYLAIAYLMIPAMWRHYENQPGLASHPMVTRTTQDIPGDPINVGLVGIRTDVIRAFLAAGWHPADPITLRSSIEIGASVVLDRPDLDAPVSTLIFEGRKQDLAFELPDGRSADRRNHVRLWLTLEKGAEGLPVFLGSASLDKGVGFSHDTGQVTHHIAADVDAERDFLIDTLRKAGVVASTYEVSGVGPTTNGRNGGGDRYFTDGEVMIAVLNAGAAKLDQPPTAKPDPPSASFVSWVWQTFIVGWLREADAV